MDDHIPPTQFELCAECNRRLEELMKSMKSPEPIVIEESEQVSYDD